MGIWIMFNIAEKYYEIKRDYKEISIELAKAALEGFNITYQELNDQQLAQTDRRIELEAAIATQEAAIENQKLHFIEKEKVLQKMQHAFNELHNTVRTKENEKSLSSQRLQYLKERENNLTDFLQQSHKQLSGIQESIQFTNQQIQEEEIKLVEFNTRLADLNNEVEIKRKDFDQKREKVDGLRKHNQTIQRSQFELEKKVAVADTSIHNLQRTIQQITDEKQQRQQQLKIVELDKQAREQELITKKSSILQLQQQNDFTKEQILKTQSVLENLRNSLAEENRKLDARKNEHDLLKSLIDSMEGYPESVKFLYKNNGWKHKAPLL